jgi:lipoprotein-anchoring transpeptidase ErfK/SrfK
MWMKSRNVTIAILSLIGPLGAETYEAAVNSGTQPEIRVGAKGSAVVRAQILLDRAHFSCGEIDGEFGSNLEKAVTAFQHDRRLPDSGAVDEPTWNALNAGRAPALMTYTISAEDVKGPFAQSIPEDLEKQAALPALSYTSPVEALAERFHAAPALLRTLNPEAKFAAGEQVVVPNVLTVPPGQAARVVVSKSKSAVSAYDAEGRLLAFYVATIGSRHDPLPVGEWKVRSVIRNPEFHYNPDLFWDARAGDAKATLKPGPNNPVGLVWIDLSKEHYGIHGTPEPSRIGHTTSHGCIRLTNWDALELAAMIRPGLPAILEE